MIESIPQSPLASLNIQNNDINYSVRLKEFTPLYIFILRVDPKDLTGLEKLESKLKCKLPNKPNTTCSALEENATIFWLGPNEWLVDCHIFDDDLTEVLLDKTDECHSVVVDISDSKSLINISGPKAVSVLEKGCTLDFDEVFSPYLSCAQTGLGQASVLIHRLAKQNNKHYEWNIYVERSFAIYLWNWLEDAAKEYNL
tara:strand:+ start:458 stop:1054 length:597 start_codon:yes stop_codon:yes gene_type:complete